MWYCNRLQLELCKMAFSVSWLFSQRRDLDGKSIKQMHSSGRLKDPTDFQLPGLQAPPSLWLPGQCGQASVNQPVKWPISNFQVLGTVASWEKIARKTRNLESGMYLT